MLWKVAGRQRLPAPAYPMEMEGLRARQEARLAFSAIPYLAVIWLPLRTLAVWVFLISLHNIEVKCVTFRSVSEVSQDSFWVMTSFLPRGDRILPEKSAKLICGSFQQPGPVM